MKKMQLNALSIGGALSREQMKTVTGGGYYPCASQCNSDADCPQINGTRGWCVMSSVGDCHNRDGSLQPPVGSCVLSSYPG
ncbi:hypothetical protein G7092_11770 [Mucilaginibacter sp. HC2]|uniref:hypothetical protein n=1 Tax=Mucilaginibacter inviolabilis TaxID=2714892 RepID=UPI00140D193C|nr:hypothetical protein [Mucilaginibacter inviolabilis]NHA04481.1 hypothetical protein [Mucilaginibacter inviolabilis]